MRSGKILVPVNGEKTDEETIKLACTLAKREKGKIHVVYVIKVIRSLPLEAEINPEIRRGEEVLDRAERIAGGEDCEIETELLQAREIGPAIVDEAAERAVDLIIVGISYKMRFGEFSLGDTLPYILKNAPCRVLVWREPASSERERVTSQ